MPALDLTVGIEWETLGVPHEHDEDCYECGHWCDDDCGEVLDCSHECGSECKFGCIHEHDDDCYRRTCVHECDGDCMELTCDSDEYSEPWDPPGWDVERDSSCGWEFVSDVIESTEDLDSLLRELAHHSGEPEVSDYNCGLHVHVGGLDLRQVAALARLWWRVEPQVWAHVAPSPSRRNYCRPWRSVLPQPPWDHRELKHWWYGMEVSPDWIPERYNPTRYRALNLNSWWFRRTVEFRLFNAPPFDPDGARAVREAVGLCLLVCRWAVRVARGEVTEDQAAEAILETVFVLAGTDPESAWQPHEDRAVAAVLALLRVPYRERERVAVAPAH